MTGSKQTRRTALRAIGATVAATGLTTTSAAQGNETDDGSDDRGDGGTDQWPIILGGRTEYWFGIAPTEIEGVENPTLNLEDGREYVLVWINIDGAEHELVFETEDGDELEASEGAETAGEAVSMTFEANEEAAEYYCEYHPESMRGDVEFDGGFDLSTHDHDHHDGHGGGNQTDGEAGHEGDGAEGDY